MNRVKLHDTLDLSRLVYGMWRLGDDSDTSTENVIAKIEACLDQGITSFDQADIYGDYESESILGAALKQTPSLRDKMDIITKCDIKLITDKVPERRVKHYDTSADHIRASVEQSLKNMNIDVIDLLLLHRPDPLMDHVETGAALDTLIAQGKVRHIGVSNFKLHDWTLLQSATKAPLVTNQIEISVLHHAPFTNGDIAWMQERGVPPMAWSPLAGGGLFANENAALHKVLANIGSDFGVDASAVAIAWLLLHPCRIMPVMGTNDLGRIAKLSEALRVTMDRETWFEIYTTAMGQEVP